jgi:hypothetical protein
METAALETADWVILGVYGLAFVTGVSVSAVRLLRRRSARLHGSVQL